MGARGPELDRLHVMVIAGGGGTRFWPRSRAALPKQLLSLWDETSLLEHTLRRFEGVVPSDRIHVVTTKALETATRETLGGKFAAVSIIPEPMGKNTAPAILLGCLEIRRLDPKAVVVVVPADHYIGKPEAFREAMVRAAGDALAKGGIVTLGIEPDRPAVEYGYVECVEERGDVRSVARFVEKPDLRTAARFVESHRFLWNAGMFVFRVEEAVLAYRKTMPGLLDLFESSDSPARAYEGISPEDATSIDYGVMERAAGVGISVRVVPMHCQWSDVGSFAALEEIGHPVRGQLVSMGSASNIVQSDAGFVALLGVNDLVVVRDQDVVLVAAKDRAQDVRRLLELVKKRFPGSA